MSVRFSGYGRSNYPLDRDLLAKELGFSGITQNSMDAVSDRDFILGTMADILRWRI